MAREQQFLGDIGMLCVPANVGAARAQQMQLGDRLRARADQEDLACRQVEKHRKETHRIESSVAENDFSILEFEARDR